MDFKVQGLSPAPFKHLFGLSEAELKEHSAIRYTVDEFPGFPERIEMRDAEVGETLILVNHQYQSADTPYQASHAIFVNETATEAYDGGANEIPEVMLRRILSLRGFTAKGMMIEADVALGVTEVRAVITTMFGNPDIAYIQAHNAKQGCYSGRIDRV
jgi:hypothetical protein